MIEVKDIVKTYKNGSLSLTVLKGLNLSVKEGEYVAFMGPSGSGKSTFMNILGCLDRLTSGKYVLDGIDVSTMKGDELSEVRNEKIGFVFQTFNLLPKMSALENVALPALYAGLKKEERLKKAEEALKTAQDSGKVAKGTNEVTKFIERGDAALVVIAEDVDPAEIVAHIPVLADEKEIPYIYLPTKEQVGGAAGLTVGTASACIVDAGDAEGDVAEIVEKIAELKE